MTAIDTLADPRTSLVLANADNLHHVVCEQCWRPGLPMVCGAADSGEPDEFCPDGCGCTPCPLCAEAWTRHERSHRPWWKRWLP